MIKPKTIAQYKILRWLESNNFYLPAFNLEFTGNGTAKLTDSENETVIIICDGDYVFIQE